MPNRIISFFAFAGASTTAAGFVDRAPAISYTRDIQPIFTEKCVACHACYDSACQLNLGSGEGAARGRPRRRSTMGTQRQASKPTRLFYDAWAKLLGSAGWFYLGTDAQAAGGVDGAHAHGHRRTPLKLNGQAARSASCWA